MRAATQRAAASTPHYQRRRPEQTPLYRLVQAHYETLPLTLTRMAQACRDSSKTSSEFMQRLAALVPRQRNKQPDVRAIASMRTASRCA